MNLTRVVLASVGGFVAYFVFGGLGFILLPSLKNEFKKYPAVYRSHESIMSTMPWGMAAMLIAIFAVALMYAFAYHGGSGVVEGTRFGALIGLFVLGAFVVHNYVNLNIGLKLTLQQSVIYFVQWVIVCLVIGLIYRPVKP
jgi:hypothetical protein